MIEALRWLITCAKRRKVKPHRLDSFFWLPRTVENPKTKLQGYIEDCAVFKFLLFSVFFSEKEADSSQADYLDLTFLDYKECKNRPFD
jgi:hypothetical protein